MVSYAEIREARKLRHDLARSVFANGEPVKYLPEDSVYLLDFLAQLATDRVSFACEWNAEEECYLVYP